METSTMESTMEQTEQTELTVMAPAVEYSVRKQPTAQLVKATQVYGPRDAAIYVCAATEIHLEPQEVIYVLLLDNRNQVVGHSMVSKGLADRCQAHAREVYRTAIMTNSTKIILVHNHPSGDPSPSPQDVDLTVGLFEAGKVLGISLLDHVIIGDNVTEDDGGPYFSFKEADCMPK